MEGIEHRMVSVNGINMHVAEKGEGPVVLFVHGFPDLWYTWRHQIVALASHGYHAVAPDLRGYGDTDAPLSSTSYTCFHVVGDLIALIDALRQDQVFLVGHDWGALIVWYFCLFRPDRVKAVVNLSITYQPRHPSMTPIQAMRALFGDSFYMCRFQKPGEAEAEFACVGTAQVFRTLLTSRNPEPPCAPKEIGLARVPDEPEILPSWLSEDDINYYARKYEKTGFTGGLNYYRAMDLNWELTAAWAAARLNVPVKFIIGDLDITYSLPSTKEYIHDGGFKEDVPFLEEVVVMEGVGHFTHQERPDEISEHILHFIRKF